LYWWVVDKDNERAGVFAVSLTL